MLGEFYFVDPRLDLVPSEHLASDGIDEAFAAALAERPGWSRGRVALLEEGIALYWDRLESLAARAPHLRPPRLRNVGVVRTPESVRPYAQILNESTWTIYLSDLDPEHSHAELVAYLLAIGDRMTETGEILRTAVHLAPWWFERSEAERSAFTRAASLSTRPDAALYREIAAAIPWLRELRHEVLRPVRQPRGHRSIPGTGLLVPRALQDEPDRLVEGMRVAASSTLEAFHRHHRDDGSVARADLLEWLADEAPPLVVTDAEQRVLWDAVRAGDVEALSKRLEPAGTAAIGDIAADLERIAVHTRRFLASVKDPASLPAPESTTAQGGYAFLHRERRRIGYNLDEPGIERLFGPALPYAREMLGARTAHEWAHLAVDAGWVPRSADDVEWTKRRARLVRGLDEVIRRAPRAEREAFTSDLGALSRRGSPGDGLADVLELRLPDFQANLLASRYESVLERETYVRQNVRSLRREYPPATKLRQLVRYLYELQYLRFSAVPNALEYFLAMTGFDDDFLATGLLSEEDLEELSSAASALCDAHAVDESRFFPPA